MAQTPADTVTAFFARWSDGIDALYRSLHDYFTPQTVYENVGVSRTVGPAEAEACLRMFEPMKTALRMDVEMLAISTQGDNVLTERIDRVIGPDGAVTATVPVMGTLQVANGRITAWRDYFDTVPFVLPGSAMSSSPIETVTAFLRCWNDGIDAIRQSLYDYLTPDCVWENVGMTRTVGPQAAEECYFSFAPMQDCSRIDVRILAIAAQGDTVLTERDERVIGKDGRETLAVRSMGAFVVKNGKFTEWRDYFMPVPFADEATGQGAATDSPASP